MLDLAMLDILVLSAMVLSLPWLVNHYLKTNYFPAELQLFVILGGIAWLIFSIYCEELSGHVLEVWIYDAGGHETWGERLAQSMAAGDWRPFREHFRLGNHAYHCYVALLLWLGASVHTVTMINAWVCFWAGLILVQSFNSVAPHPSQGKGWVLLTIFFPSVIFWGTMNLKEGWMYWSVCNVLAAAFHDPRDTFFRKTPWIFPAIVVGSLFRAHVILGWVIAVVAVNVFQTGKRSVALLLILALPFMFWALKEKTGIDLSTESAMDTLDQRFAVLYRSGHQGSRIEYMAGKPIFFISGAVSAFFRPFPWQVNSLRTLVSCLETWVVTLSLLVVWARFGTSYGRMALRLPSIRASILASIWVCILLSYFPNEGLVVRQKIQMVPGLLALAIVPLRVREDLRLKFFLRNAMLPRWLSPAREAPPG
ncbi:MAG: hypothetical protein AB1664_22975 [Thermodesulfobacteriota bacterium]